MTFKNEPLTDFTLVEERNRMTTSLNELHQQLSSSPRTAFPIIQGKEIPTPQTITRPDPSDIRTQFSTVHMAGPAEVATALTSLQQGRLGWHKRGYEARARILEQVGTLLRQRKFEFSALIIREAGKPWREADGDVAEAIDFCFYYAEQMRNMGPPRPTDDAPGEETSYFYQPRGLTVVIAPWNFPLAIACGMTVAALVTGNVTILKPAEQTSVVAYEFAKILLQAGVPPDAFAFLPGAGDEIGPLLVQSAHTDMICFTGSKQVGLQIIRSAAAASDYIGVKKVVAEMGGKNAIIIDSDADLDEAIKGALSSSFGFAGQKCSACSRIIVVKDAYDQFVSRFSEAAGDIILGAAKDPGVFLGPVIDKEAHDRILQTITSAKSEYKLAFEYQLTSELAANGYYIAPTAFRDVPTNASIWNEEIFGPVVAITKADTFDHALQIANTSQYALTGGVFSRSPRHLQQAREEFLVGNLYLNRSITGAMVRRHPFGGFRFSGIGSKAGGPDYLIQFVEPRAVAENTLRRGFAPEIGGR